ncbi:hypothetical protein I3843_09G083800 [Carya illinoinensis]|nr:hypothetical protein I3843_09G083800 [Carya illinoinensis]
MDILIIFLCNSRALSQGEPFQKFSTANVEPRPKRGFGNSFQLVIDASRLEPYSLRHCPKRKDKALMKFQIHL